MICVNPFSLFLKEKKMVIPVSCGKCIACKVNDSRDWRLRLIHESYFSANNYFITLTIDDNHINLLDNDYDKSFIQRFFNSLRKKVGKLRYYLVAERGSQTNRLHYHCLTYHKNFKIDVNDYISSWKYGFLSIKPLTVENISYVTRYVGKNRIFRVMSRRPGIGKSWIDKNLDYLQNLNTATVYNPDNPSSRLRCPKYYINQFNPDSRRLEAASRRYYYLNDVIKNYNKNMLLARDCALDKSKAFIADKLAFLRFKGELQ